MPTSKSIVGARTILFLGAGASKPFNKMLMGEFVSHLQTRYPKSDLLKVVCAKQADLEFLIGQLEDLSSKRYFAQGTTVKGAVTTYIWPAVVKLAQDAANLLQIVKREVYTHYRSIENRETLSPIYKGLLGTLSKGKTDHVIFTTNYDPAVETFVSEQEDFRLIDGFAHNPKLQQYIWNRSVFDNFRPDEKLGTVVLFKLHGSTNWFRNEGRITKANPIFAACDSEYEHVLIYPATRKIATTDPFFAAYDYLAKCLVAAERCLAVGYSFRDYDTLMRFKAASLENPRLRVTVLDPNADELVAFLTKKRFTLSLCPKCL